MKRALSFIVAMLLIVLVIGGVYAVTQDNADSSSSSKVDSSISEEETSDSASSGIGNSSTEDIDSGSNDSSNWDGEDSSNSDSSNVNSGNTDGGNTDSGGAEEDNTLKNPANVASYIASGLEMRPGAAVYLGEEEYEPAIRFTCKVSATLKNTLDNDDSKSLAFLIAPVDTFDEVNPNNYTYMDWVTEFNKAGKTKIYSVLESNNIQQSGDEYFVAFRLQNVLYTNMNRNFVCMTVLATKSGNTTTYKYNAYPAGVDYRSNARSVAYVAAAALNANALGMESFSSQEVERLKGYVNQSVDLANGKAQATEDGSMYAFTTNITAPQTLSVGETLTVVTTLFPEVNVPVWYRSSDEAVIEVDANGKVTAKAKGTAVVGVYVAGESYGITVTVA